MKNIESLRMCDFGKRKGCRGERVLVSCKNLSNGSRAFVTIRETLHPRLLQKMTIRRKRKNLLTREIFTGARCLPTS